jgi:hypothetical protein
LISKLDTHDTKSMTGDIVAILKEPMVALSCTINPQGDTAMSGPRNDSGSSPEKNTHIAPFGHSSRRRDDTQCGRGSRPHDLILVSTGTRSIPTIRSNARANTSKSRCSQKDYGM